MRFAFRFYVLALVSLAISVAMHAGHTGSRSKVHLIDSHGGQIPSIFYRASPNPRFALELLRNRGNAGSCSIRDAVYHPSDRLARVVKVGGCPFSHYMNDYYRDCAYCGGTEDWTYSDPFTSEYCIGYSISRTGCDPGNCTEEFTCYSDYC